MSFAGIRSGADITANSLDQEIKMSISIHHTMTNHHEARVLERLAETFRAWRERRQQRRELALMSLRDLHDAGISWTDAAYEIDKPFWRG
jgi:uncharacterized protein YjiS (DUF1127 family)